MIYRRFMFKALWNITIIGIRTVRLSQLYSESPHASIQQDSQKVNIWCALSQREAICPFFICDKSIDINIYLDILENFTIPNIKRYNKVIYQQDGISRCEYIINCLDEQFPQKMDFSWWSESLTSSIFRFNSVGFFVWCYVNDCVYKTHCINCRKKLKRSITSAIQSITSHMLINT